MRFAIFLHLAGAFIWIGGMLFAYFSLRPSTALLERSQRLTLWGETLRRFFQWVWASLAMIFGSGFYMLTLLSGSTRVPVNVHVMLYVGIIMLLIFLYVVLGPFPAFKRAIAEQNWDAGAMALDAIRKAVGVNLALGVINMAVATIGRM